jgi:hypothetical protein
LDLAHEHGLVHRDVKPGNILVESGADPDDPDHVFLADFGIAKHALSSSGLTDTGQFMGTVDYVAPEQIQAHRVDAGADEYSLGCVLFECLTGQVPFVRNIDAAVLWAHVEDDPPRASSLRPGLPLAIDEVLARALAKNPADRYPTSRAMMADARAALGNPDLSHVRLVSRAPGQLGRPATDPEDTRRPAAGGPPEPQSPAGRPVASVSPAASGLPDAAPPAASTPPAMTGSGEWSAAAVGPPSPGPRPAAEPRGGRRPGAPGANGRGRMPVPLLAVAAVLVVLAGAVGTGAWLFSHDSSATSAAQAPGGTGTSTTATQSTNPLLLAISDPRKAMLPSSSCEAMEATYVVCTEPYDTITRVELRRYPTLDALYDHYVAATKSLTREPLQTNTEDCNRKEIHGEVSWTHDFRHLKRFSLAQSRSGDLSEMEAEGRVFCVYTGGVMHFVWTDNDGLMLGTVEGYAHESTWKWWHDVHHNLPVAYFATHDSSQSAPSDMTDMTQRDDSLSGTHSPSSDQSGTDMDSESP